MPKNVVMILFIDIITIKCEELKNRHNQIVTQFAYT